MQKRGVVVILIILLVFSILFSYWYFSYRVSAIENSYDSKGWKLYREGKYQDAIEEFNRNLMKNNRNPYAYEGIGESYLALSDKPYSSDYSGVQDYSKKAIEAFRKSLEYEPNQITEYIGLGRALYRYSINDENVAEISNMEELSEAKSLLSHAIDLDPRNPDPYTTLGWVYIGNIEKPVDNNEAGNISIFSTAIGTFNTSIILKPSADAYVGLGFAYLYSFDLENAIISANKAIELAPDNPEPYDTLGWSYYYLSQIEDSKEKMQKSRENFEKVVELAPKYFAGHLGLGYLNLLVLNDTKTAKIYFDNAIRLRPFDTLTVGALGKYYFFTGEYDKSIEFYDKAIELDPQAKARYSDFMISKGFALIQIGSYAEAIKLFNKSLGLTSTKNVKNYEMLSLVGLVTAYTELGAKSQAELYLPQIMKLQKEAKNTQFPFLAKKFNSCMQNKPFVVENVHFCGKELK